MERAGDFIARVARRLDRPEAALAWLSGSWPGIVGQALAAHTRPVACESGCLEILADAKPWRNQLEEMRKEFCSEINRAWGSTLVKEIRFVSAQAADKPQSSASGPGPQGPDELRISHEQDNEYTPFVRRKRP